MAPKVPEKEAPLPLRTADGGAMHGGCKRRNDGELSPSLDSKGSGKGSQVAQVVHYHDGFDLKRLEHMVVSYQLSSVLASYPHRPWEFETVGSRKALMEAVAKTCKGSSSWIA